MESPLIVGFFYTVISQLSKTSFQNCSQLLYLSLFRKILNRVSKVKILLADSQYLVRLGLRHILNRNKDIEVVGECSHSNELLDKIIKYKPEVVMLDYHNGIHFDISDIKKIKSLSPKTNVMVISSDDNRENIHKTLEFGINSYLTKQCDKDEITSAIHATAKGEKFFCNKVLNIILEKHLQKDEDDDCLPTELTVREVQIVKLITQGKSSKEIANQLHLSHHTVNTHRKNVLKKLNLKSSTELILYAVKSGIINTNT